jgi:hypothetical protein
MIEREPNLEPRRVQGYMNRNLTGLRVAESRGRSETFQLV